MSGYRRWAITPMVAVLVLAVFVAPAFAGAVLSGSGWNLQILDRNDDGSTPNILLPFPINFFGQTFTVVNVNNNGNFTFGLNQQMSTYTPFGLTTETGKAIIAPFFADVDTRNPSSYRVQFGNVTLNGHTAFLGEYVNLGYYDEHADKTNSFQVLLVDRSDIAAGDFDIEYNYDSIKWETGDASGGINGFGGQSAHVGYSNGSGVAGSNYELPGSGVNGAFLDGGPNSLAAGSFNSGGIAGRYIFPVRNGAPIDPGTIPTYPIQPTVLIPGNWRQPPLLQFNLQPRRRWFDPPLVYGYQYDMTTDGGLFTEVQTPVGSAFANLLIQFAGGSQSCDSSTVSCDFLFPDSGVSTFTITGIDPLLNAGDPNFASAFATFLDFNMDTASFTMTPLSNTNTGPGGVPEPATVSMMLGAGVLLLALRRRAAR